MFFKNIGSDDERAAVAVLMEVDSIRKSAKDGGFQWEKGEEIDSEAFENALLNNSRYADHSNFFYRNYGELAYQTTGGLFFGWRESPGWREPKIEVFIGHPDGDQPREDSTLRRLLLDLGFHEELQEKNWLQEKICGSRKRNIMLLKDFLLKL